MATVVADEIKRELMSRGIWPDFVRLREDMRREDSKKTCAERTAAVLEKIAPDLVDRVRTRGRPPKKSAEKPAPDLGEEMRWQKHGVNKEPPAVRTLVSKSVFDGKSCNISTAFMWAYSSLCIKDVSPEDAPSAVAWQMYVDMVTSPSLKADMLKSGLGAAMRKAENEDGGIGRFDGEGEYDLLAAIANGGGE